MSKPMTFTQDQLHVSADDAMAAIEALGPSAEALISAWVQAENAAAVQEVAERGAGATRKSARRSLSVLKARRVVIPVRPRKGSVITPEKVEVEAWLLAPDAAGIRLLALSRGSGSGAIHAAMIYVRDDQGVLRVENAETTPNKLKQSLKGLLPGTGFGPVPVPVDWARYKIAQARVTHKKSGVPEPLGFSTAAPLISPVPTDAPEHPFDSEGFEFSVEDARELAKDSGALHHLPEFRSWLPTEASVRDLLARTGEQFPIGEQPPQDAVTELLKEQMLVATDSYFTPELRADLVGRMKDAGLSVLGRAGEEEALQVAATIQAVNHCDATENPPRSVPFLRAFFEKAVSVLMARGN
ncbi:MAG: hypothetical protein RJA70_2473, partial [Pseudomonadota bacterium]